MAREISANAISAESESAMRCQRGVSMGNENEEMKNNQWWWNDNRKLSAWMASKASGGKIMTVPKYCWKKYSEKSAV